MPWFCSPWGRQIQHASCEWLLVHANSSVFASMGQDCATFILTICWCRHPCCSAQNCCLIYVLWESTKHRSLPRGCLDCSPRDIFPSPAPLALWQWAGSLGGAWCPDVLILWSNPWCWEGSGSQIPQHIYSEQRIVTRSTRAALGLEWSQMKRRKSRA